MLHVVTHNYMYLHKIHVVSQELYTCICRFANKVLVITQKLHVLQKNAIIKYSFRHYMEQNIHYM